MTQPSTRKPARSATSTLNSAPSPSRVYPNKQKGIKDGGHCGGLHPGLERLGSDWNNRIVGPRPPSHFRDGSAPYCSRLRCKLPFPGAVFTIALHRFGDGLGSL